MLFGYHPDIIYIMGECSNYSKIIMFYKIICSILIKVFHVNVCNIKCVFLYIFRSGRRETNLHTIPMSSLR